jgi:CrcB protein
VNALYVILGAAIGAPLRFWIDQQLRARHRFPYGILVVNVVGSFIIGLVIGSGESIHSLVATGFAGAFTTWSTFILDLYLAYELKRYKEVALNLGISLILGLSAAWLGIQLIS